MFVFGFYACWSSDYGHTDLSLSICLSANLTLTVTSDLYDIQCSYLVCILPGQAATDDISFNRPVTLTQWPQRQRGMSQCVVLNGNTICTYTQMLKSCPCFKGSSPWCSLRAVVVAVEDMLIIFFRERQTSTGIHIGCFPFFYFMYVLIALILEHCCKPLCIWKWADMDFVVVCCCFNFVWQLSFKWKI